MTGDGRDWDKEMAAIDRAIARLPEPAAEAAAVPAPATQAGSAPTRRGAFGAWLRVVLALALAVALPFWPYARQCGLGLFGYLAAIGVLALTGLWGAVAAWRQRLAVAHTLALLTLLWALALAARELLPRIGYARTAAAWLCEAAPTPSGPAPANP